MDESPLPMPTRQTMRQSSEAGIASPPVRDEAFTCVESSGLSPAGVSILQVGQRRALSLTADVEHEYCTVFQKAMITAAP